MSKNKRIIFCDYWTYFMKPLLENISDELLQILKKTGQTKIFSKGNEIFAEGSNADFLPIILNGKVKMIHFLEAGKEVIIGIFQEGEMFAVPPVFDGAPYPSTAIAMEKTKLLMLYRQDFLRLLRESSDFSFAVIDWTCKMLREKTATIQNLATASSVYRTGNVLLQLASKENDDSRPIKIFLRRQDIAEIAGLTTETTIRAIRQFAVKNLIRIQHGKIIIDDPKLLRDFIHH
jgi:CRP/FNR family transcriptional regulator, cyclic AMP receptor protein